MIDFARDIPFDSALGRMLRWPARWVRPGRVMRVLSGPLRGQKWILGAGLHGCWLGTYELKKQRLVRQELAPGMVVYDIGANVGFYSLLAARAVGSTGQVYAFEPAPRNAAYLREHLKLNDCTHAHVFELAVGGTDGFASFELSESALEGRLAAAGGIHVPVRTLNSLLAAREILPADLVKIDVEGAELAVLKGGENFFLAHRPGIFLATHGTEVHRACCDLLCRWGYSLSTLEAGGDLASSDELYAFHRERSQT